MDIYLDDYHLHSTTERLHPMVKRDIEGLEGGEPRITVYNNPGFRGQTVSQILPGSSLITIHGSLRSVNGVNDRERLDDYAAARRLLNDDIKFEYDQSNHIIPKTLRVTMPDGAQYQATVYRFNNRNPIQYNTYGTWTLELLNPSGLMESQTLTSHTITLPQPGGVVYPVVYPTVYGAVSGGSAIASNYGDAEVQPIITLYGPMANPVISNDSGGKFMRLNMVIESGRRVVVDMATPSIMEGSLTAAPTNNRQDMKATGSAFWTIKPGTNTIRLRATTYDVGYATVEYRSAWYGI